MTTPHRCGRWNCNRPATHYTERRLPGGFDEWCFKCAPPDAKPFDKREAKPERSP